MNEPGPGTGRWTPGPGRRLLAAVRRGAADRLRDLAGIDERTLAALRITLAILVLADLAFRLPELAVHYADSGLLPRSLAAADFPLASRVFFLYFASGSVVWAALLFALTAIAALLLLLGWRTGWACAATWFLVSCLHVRAPQVTNGGDELLRLVLLWSLLLPLGAAASLDDRRHPAAGPRRIVSLATLGLQLHLTGLFLAEAVTGLEQTALLEALHLDHLASAWGLELRQMEDLVRFAGLTIGGFGLLAPLLLWIPFWTGPLRFFVVVTFWQVHLLFLAPALELGIQPWAASVAWLTFLPGWIWGFVTEGRVAQDSRLLPARGRARVVASAAAVMLVLAALQLATARSRSPGAVSPATWARDAARLLGLAPQQSLLLPGSEAIDGWYVVRSRLPDGSDWDVWNDRPATLDKPAVPSRTFRSARWTAYLMRLVAVDAHDQRGRLLDYLCRTWNRAHGPEARAETIELVFMLERYDPSSDESQHLPVPLAASACAGPS